MISNLTRMNSFIVCEQDKYIRSNSNYKLNELGGNTHEVGLNAGNTRMLHECLGPNSVATRSQYTCHVVNMKPRHRIKSCVNIDGWSVSQTFSTAHDRSHHILNTLILNMPSVKKARKTQKRDSSPSPAVSECSTESAQTTTEVEIHTRKEPYGHVDVSEAAESTLTKESSIGDTPIPPTQHDVSKKRIKSTSVILADQDEARVVEWLADHPLMFNKKIKEYKETDKKEKL